MIFRSVQRVPLLDLMGALVSDFAAIADRSTSCKSWDSIANGRYRVPPEIRLWRFALERSIGQDQKNVGSENYCYDKRS